MIRETNSRDFTADGKVIPDREDYDAIERQYGRLPDDAPDEKHARRYRLAQSRKLTRLWFGKAAAPIAGN